MSTTDDCRTAYEVIRNQPTVLPGEVQQLIRSMTGEFLSEFYNFLRERGIDVTTSKCVFAGGGSLLLRGMIERANKVAFPIFIEDIHANARGYELLYQSEVASNRQVLELLEYGIEERDIYVDKQSGRSFERTNYMSLRNSILRNGDILVVKSIDRFGRNYSGIRTEWEYLTKTLGVDIVVLDTPILDTTRYKDLLGSVITDIVLAVLSFGAQLEVDTKSKAQAEGIAAAHLKGVKFGRPKCSVKDWDIYYPKWKQGEITAVECYRQLGVSASTFYRLVHKFESEEKAR